MACGVVMLVALNVPVLHQAEQSKIAAPTRGLHLFDTAVPWKWSPVRTEHLQDKSLGPGNFFRLSNFKVYFHYMIDLELHVHFVAAMMADALETMH